MSAKQLTEKIDPPSMSGKNKFLTVKIFGTDSCYGTGMPRSRFSISEDGTSVIFTLSPCGSGGRLKMSQLPRHIFIKTTRAEIKNF